MDKWMGVGGWVNSSSFFSPNPRRIFAWRFVLVAVMVFLPLVRIFGRQKTNPESSARHSKKNRDVWSAADKRMLAVFFSFCQLR